MLFSDRFSKQNVWMLNYYNRYIYHSCSSENNKKKFAVGQAKSYVFYMKKKPVMKKSFFLKGLD